MTDTTDYQKYAQKKLDELTPIFAKAAVGDFNENVNLPDENDEFTTLFVGVQIMLEVIREKITEYEKVNLALTHLVEEKTALINSIGDGVLVTDENGIITFMNPAAETLLGWKSEEVLHKPAFNVVKLLDEKGNPLPDETRPLYTALKKGRQVKAEYYCIRKDASRFAALITVSPVLLGNKIVGAVDVFKDYTEQSQIDRMKSEFISLAAHQLRTPLSSMRWDMELLLHSKSLSVSPQVQEKLTRIYDGTKRMIDLVSELLNVSKIAQGAVANKPQKSDIAALMQTIVTELTPLATKKSISITLDKVPSSLPPIMVDQERCKEVFENIITNAIKFNSANGSITISIQEDSEDFITISVTDTGMGIPQADQKKLFTKFFRATNAAQAQIEGTGLGLFMVKSYVEEWGGRVWLESPTQANGTGTTVYIQLPKTLKKVLIRKEIKMPKILIIEDDGALQRIYKEALEAENFEIYAELTAKEGLLQAQNLKPNLILLDIMLPGGMNGFDILEQLKKDEQLKNIPVIVLTNLDTEKATALKIGALDYIVKANTSIDEVVNKVKKYLAGN